MSKDLKHTLSYIRDKFHHTEGLSFGTRGRLEGDWKIIFFSFVLLNLAVIGFSLVVYLNTSTIQFEDTEAVDLGVPTFNRQELLRQVEEFEERRAEFFERSSRPPVLPDPSLSS